MPRLFGSAINKMFPVFKRMAIWAQDFQVIKSIILSISIFVMNTKYLFMFIISASFTSCYPSSSYKSSANIFRFFGNFKYISLGKIVANMATKLCLIVSLIYVKFLSALLAYNRYRARIISCFSSTGARAIFFNHILIAFVCKFFSAFSASPCSLFVVLSKISKCITFMRAKFCDFTSPLRNIKRLFTMQAYNFIHNLSISQQYLPVKNKKELSYAS